MVILVFAIFCEHPLVDLLAIELNRMILRDREVFLKFFKIFVNTSMSAVLPDYSTTLDNSGGDGFGGFEVEFEWYDWLAVFYAAIAVATAALCTLAGTCTYCKSSSYDALSEKCYTDIIAARGYNSTNKVVGDSRPLALLVMRQDLLEKRIWHNDCKKDFCVFLRNEHSLFSTCYSHPDHPFTRRDRRCILLSVVLMNFGIAMGITYWLATMHISSNEWVEFAVDKGLSYIFGFTLSVLESFLVSIAVCSAGES